MAGRRVGRCGGGVEVLESIYSVVALVLILVACVELGDAATAVDVYRLIQYDLAGVPYGSRLAGLNHHAGAFPFAAGADLSRSVVMMPVRELNFTFLQEYIINKQPLGGLLFLLPQKVSKKIVGEIKSKDDGLMRKILVELEQLLIHASISYPVYFAFEDDKINALLADVRRGDATGQPATATTGGYKLVVSSPEPKKLSSPTITNIQGWLPGLKGEGDTNQLPTIAVVAPYDTFGAAPALSVGSDGNGGGVVALLEIARLFSRLYSNPKTRGRYNLLFGLTSGGPYNYNGTLKWLRSFDQRLRESIDYAICLNSIGSWNNELWIHVSKPPENAYIKQVHESLSDIAKEQGVTIGIKHKKINISDPRVAWEHEQFSRLRITAVTLSELSAAPELLENTGGLYDTRDSVDEAAVYRSIKLIAESLANYFRRAKQHNAGSQAVAHINIILPSGILAEVPEEENSLIRELCRLNPPRTSADTSQILIRHIYGYQGRNIQIFADNSSLAVNPSYVKSWLDLLSRTPRVAPFLSKTDPIISALKKELSDHTVEVHLQHETIDGMFSFYDSTRATLYIYQVASVAFDLLLLLVLGSYLILLFTFLVITTRGLDDLINLFRRPPSRKVKAS